MSTEVEKWLRRANFARSMEMETRKRFDGAMVHIAAVAEMVGAGGEVVEQQDDTYWVLSWLNRAADEAMERMRVEQLKEEQRAVQDTVAGTAVGG